MMDIVKGLDAWFAERLQGLNYRPETVAYVAGVLKAQANPKMHECMAGRSIVLAYIDAKEKGDFVEYQRIGDWVLFVNVILPESIQHEREAVTTIGRLSYYSCHRLIRYKWDLYEELADELPSLAMHVRRKLV